MGAKETAMIVLTEEQRKELATPEPLARDPQTNELYVLVKIDQYRRIKALLHDELPDAGVLMNEVMASDDANDPYLDSYQQYARETP
jgi:hypothetical protein